jgi:hypothetical protein
MRGIGAGTRIFELLDRTPAIPPDDGISVPTDRRGVLKFENIKFEYPSRKGAEILRNFNLEIAVGESVAIVYVFFVSLYLLRLHVGIEERVEEANLPYTRCFCGTTTQWRVR